MSVAFFSFSRVWQIASLTLLEAIRQKLFNFLLLIGVVLMGSSLLFREFNFGYNELKFIMDFGFGTIVLFGSILAIVGMAQLYYSEIDNRTALTLLAKPVLKSEFLMGKLLGVLLVLLCFVLLMSVILSGLIYWREAQLLAEMDIIDGVAVDRIYPLDVFYYTFAHWLRLAVLASITLCIASFASTNLYTVVVSFMVMLICQMQHVARSSWGNLDSPVLQWLVWGLGLLFPNLQIFNLTDFGESGANLSAAAYLQMTGYGVLYTFVFLGLAIWAFRNREI